LRVTVLGKSPSWQDAGGACSGYLIQEGTTTLLLDCGNGIFGKLRKYVDYVDVDAVVISHMHADHMLDLVPYSYALKYAPRQQPVPVHGWPGTDEPVRPRLFAPSGATEIFRRVTGAWGSEDLIETAFELEEYTAVSELELGSLTVRFCPVPHFIDTYAVEVSSGEQKFVYSADCAPNEELIEFAAGADLAFLEGTLPRAERSGPRGHLTPQEAGQHARRAGVKQVALTHISDELDWEWAEQQATEAFGSEVKLVAEGDAFELGE